MACVARCRYVAQVIAESTTTGSGVRPFYDFLESCLRHKAELVIFEAARAITAMPDVTMRELAPAITVLQLFLTSSKPVLRFAAVRTLNKARAACSPNMVSVQPWCGAVQECRADLDRTQSQALACRSKQRMISDGWNLLGHGSLDMWWLSMVGVQPLLRVQE